MGSESRVLSNPGIERDEVEGESYQSSNPIFMSEPSGSSKPKLWSESSGSSKPKSWSELDW